MDLLRLAASLEADPCVRFAWAESVRSGRLRLRWILSQTWSALTAKLSKEPLGPALRAAAGLGDDDLIALFLMHERAMVAAGTPGDRAAHVSCLPSSYDSTLFWTEEELAELAGCNLLVISARLQAQVEADFAALQETVLGPNPAAFPPAHCGLDAYKWALGTLWSRSMDFAVSPTSSIRCIVPWARTCAQCTRERSCCAAPEVTSNLWGENDLLSFLSLPLSRRTCSTTKTTLRCATPLRRAPNRSQYSQAERTRRGSRRVFFRDACGSL